MNGIQFRDHSGNSVGRALDLQPKSSWARRPIRTERSKTTDGPTRRPHSPLLEALRDVARGKESHLH
jgi:hypothetical protein